MYEKTVRLVEKWSEIIYFIVMRVLLPALMIPKFIISFIGYFAMDMGGDAFELPFPVW